jgi:hypothetical protein
LSDGLCEDCQVGNPLEINVSKLFFPVLIYFQFGPYSIEY